MNWDKPYMENDTFSLCAGFTTTKNNKWFQSQIAWSTHFSQFLYKLQLRLEPENEKVWEIYLINDL
jgi:hypothetical protein